MRSEPLSKMRSPSPQDHFQTIALALEQRLLIVCPARLSSLILSPLKYAGPEIEMTARTELAEDEESRFDM